MNPPPPAALASKRNSQPRTKPLPGVGGGSLHFDQEVAKTGFSVLRTHINYYLSLRGWGPPLLLEGVAAPSRPCPPGYLLPAFCPIRRDQFSNVDLCISNRWVGLGRGDWTCSGQKADRGLPVFTHEPGHGCGRAPRRAPLAYRRQMRHMIGHLVPYRTKWLIISAASPLRGAHCR